MTHTVCILTTDAERADTDLVCVAMGWAQTGGISMGMPCAANGSSPATNWAAQQQCDQADVDFFSAIKAGTWPASPRVGAWADYSLDATKQAAITSALVIDVKVDDGTIDYAANLRDFIAANGLMVVMNGLLA